MSEEEERTVVAVSEELEFSEVRMRGMSLLFACSMRLAARSAYALTGVARWAWQHSILSTPALRSSVTFRTLAKPRRGTRPPEP